MADRARVVRPTERVAAHGGAGCSPLAILAHEASGCQYHGLCIGAPPDKRVLGASANPWRACSPGSTSADKCQGLANWWTLRRPRSGVDVVAHNIYFCCFACQPWGPGNGAVLPCEIGGALLLKLPVVRYCGSSAFITRSRPSSSSPSFLHATWTFGSRSVDLLRTSDNA
jgi:hypothetical protein